MWGILILGLVIGARVALSKHWEKGGDCARELAEAVAGACEDKPHFKFLYEDAVALRERVERIAKEVYCANGISYFSGAEAKAIEADPALSRLGACMVKTHLSLTHDPTIKGRCRGCSRQAHHYRSMCKPGGPFGGLFFSSWRSHGGPGARPGLAKPAACLYDGAHGESRSH